VYSERGCMQRRVRLFTSYLGCVSASRPRFGVKDRSASFRGMNHARGSKEINRTFVQRCTEARPWQGSLARAGFVSECYVSRNIRNETFVIGE